MRLKEEIDSVIKKMLHEKWEEREGRIVPNSENVHFRNEGVWLDATILYADMADSTDLVDTY